VSELYADASALTKLVVDERESAALRAFLSAREGVLVASALVRVEVTRAARVREAETGAARLSRLWEIVDVVPVDDAVLALAARLADARLRSLDAIHLATAVTSGIDEMLVYDDRLSEAAEAAGIRVVAPA
jgi:predicted nucleic acid-binding protein